MIDTKLFKAKINNSTNKIECFMTAMDGSTIELAPFDLNQQGLIGALLLGADINAGKFIVKGAVKNNIDNVRKLEYDLV
jgi:hypothetical protein